MSNTSNYGLACLRLNLRVSSLFFRRLGSYTYPHLLALVTTLLLLLGCHPDPISLDQNPSSPLGAGVESAGVESAGTESAGAESAGTESAGTESAGTESAGTEECATPSRRLRRLSHREYSNTLRDLLGVEVSSIGSLVADPKRGGFDQDPNLLTVSPLLAENYQLIAESVAEHLLEEGAPSIEVNCQEDEEEGRCLYRWLLNLGDRLYRRPLTAQEADQLFELYSLVASDSCQADGLKWVITALLQSPHFLYRSELGAAEPRLDSFTLNPFERANTLSYLLWQTAPDEELFALARSGALMNEEVIEAQIDRMMTDPKHFSAVNAFLDQWLGLDQILQVTRDPIIYEALYFELREMMQAETRLFFQSLWERDASLSELFISSQTWINQSLARYYGVEDAWNTSTEERSIETQLDAQNTTSAYRLTPLPNTRAGGILAHGSLLTIYAHPTSSSPIHRGLFVRDRLLCETLPPPPEGLDIQLPTTQPGEDTRTRFSAHSANPACAGCHQFIDSIGFTFEAFDGIGRWRAEDEGVVVDSTGGITLQDLSSVPFEHLGDLATYLSESDQVYRCYVRQWMRFAQGEAEEIAPFGYESSELACEIDEIISRSSAHDASLTAPLKALALALIERPRRGDELDQDLPSDILSRQTQPLEERIGQSALNLDRSISPERCADSSVSSGEGYRDLTSGLVLAVREDRWETGMCAYYTITNPSEAPLIWSVSINLEGTLNNHWNAQTQEDGAWTTFSGLAWNQEVMSGGSVEFGLCLSL